MKKNKRKKTKRFLLFLSSVIVIVLVVLGITFFLNKKDPMHPVSKPSQPNVIQTNPNGKFNTTRNDYFPKKLDIQKIYSLIRIKNGDYYFQEELVSLVLNQIIKNGSFVNGKLTYFYNFEDNNKVLTMSCKWTSSSGDTQSKSYTLKLII